MLNKWCFISLQILYKPVNLILSHFCIHQFSSKAVVSTCRPSADKHLITMRPWPMTFWPQGWCMPSNCRMSTEFWVHSSRHSPFRVQTDRQDKRQTDKVTNTTDHPNHTAGLGKNRLTASDHLKPVWLVNHLSDKAAINHKQARRAAGLACQHNDIYHDGRHLYLEQLQGRSHNTSTVQFFTLDQLLWQLVLTTHAGHNRNMGSIFSSVCDFASMSVGLSLICIIKEKWLELSTLKLLDI